MSKQKKMWFACGYDQCSRIFPSEGLLNRHSSTHKTYTRKIVQSDRRYKCEICPASFNQCHNLITHIYSHTGEKPFVCQYKDCGQKFTQKASLSRHMKGLHKKPNSFKCSHCSKTFNFKGSLVLHLRKHTGEKPYACEFCDYRCYARATLSLHAKSWHKDKEKPSEESHPKSKNIVFSNKLMVRLTPLSKEEISKLMGIKSGPIKQEKQASFHKKIFSCKKCSKSFTSYQALGAHTKIHKHLKIQQQKAIQKSVNLKAKHLKKRKLEEPTRPNANKLEEPSRSTVEPEDPAKEKPKREVPVKTKSKWEEPAKPFPCAHCEMSYSYKSYLDLHMMSHRNMETMIKIEDKPLSVEEEDFSQISEDDLQDTCSDNFDFESRVSDIESIASTSEKCDDVLEKEFCWPTGGIETENLAQETVKSAIPSRENDVLQFVNTCNTNPEPMFSDEKSTLNNDNETNIAEQVTLLVEENEAINDSDMKEDENIFVNAECNTETCNSSIEVTNSNIGLSKEDLSEKNEMNDDSFTIIDENNDFHKAIVEVKIEATNNNFTCHECGKKSRDQYLLFRHIQTQHNKDAGPWDDGPRIKRKKSLNNVKNPEPKSSIDTLSTLKTEIDLGTYLEEIRVTNQDICTMNGEDSSNKIMSKKQQKMNKQVNKKTNFSTTNHKPYACSCKKKFVREKSLHKHLAMKIDCIPLHFQVNTTSSKQSSVEMKDSQNVENLSSSSASFSCGVCKKEYSSYDILLSHIKMIHRKGEKATDFIINRLIRRPDKIKMFRCPFCPTTFTRYGNLMRHVRTSHGTPEKKDCSSNLYEKEQTARADLTKTLSVTDDFPMSGENVIFAKKTELDFTNSPQSTEIISGSEDNCSSLVEMYGKDDSSEVSQRETNDSKLKKESPQEFPQTNFLTGNSKNIKQGLRKNQNFCSSCPKIFVSTFHLDRHMKLKHQEEKTVKTEPQIVIKNDVVKNNYPKKKLSNKTLICPYTQCNRKFSNQITLNYHMLIHSDVQAMKASKEPKVETQRGPETNFVCKICGNNYANQFSLDRHMSNKLIHLPGYRKRKSGFKRTRRWNGIKRTTLEMADRTSRLKKLAATASISQSHLKKTAQPSGPLKLKQFARPKEFVKPPKLPPMNRTSKFKKLTKSPSLSKLQKLAVALCIPCSVYLERSLIINP